MAWQPWSSGNPVVSALTGVPPVVNPAPAVLPTGSQYTPEQWAQMQQQNWQQWAQWQQQYQQWHQQYGAEYQKSLSALSQATRTTSFQPPIPNTSVPPPLPKESNPPLPPEDPPSNPSQSQNKSYSTGHQQNFLSAPPPSFNTAPPQNPTQAQFKAAAVPHNQPPPNIRTNPAGNFNYNQSRPNQNQYSDVARNPVVTPNKPEYSGEKRPVPQPTFKDPKKAKIDDTFSATQPARTQPINPSEDLSETEKKFIKQFTEWEAQFNKWKEQNMNHPDKEQYKEYEKKWEAWRTQLLERREQMRRKRLGLADNKQSTETKLLIPPPMKQPPAFSASIPPPLTKDIIDTSKPPPQMGKDSSVSKEYPVVKDSSVPKEYPVAKDSSVSKEYPVVKESIPGETPSSAKESHTNEPPSKEPQEDDGNENSFLKISKSNDGIPGLDLVKDGQEEEKRDDVIDLEKEECNKDKNQDSGKVPDSNKGPDFEAISKGINNILGDQKLLNMLSMVSQNQSTQILSSSVDTTSKIQSNVEPQSNFRNLNEGPTQGGDRWSSADDFIRTNDNVSNYDEQTRSSFGGGRGGGDFEWRDRHNKGGGFNPNDFNAGPDDKKYENNSFGRRNFNKQDNFRGPDNFKGQDRPNDTFRGPDNFRGGTDGFRSDKGPNNFRKSDNFAGSVNPFGGPEQFRNTNFRGGGFAENKEHQCTFEPPPPDNFRAPENFRPFDNNRGSQNFGRNENFNFKDNYRRPGGFANRGPSNLQNKEFGGNRDSDNFRPKDNLAGDNARFPDQGKFRPNDRRNFDRNTFPNVTGGNFKPELNQQGQSNFRGRPDSRAPPGNFNRGPNEFNRGPNFQGDRKLIGGSREPPGDFQGNFDNKSIWLNQGPKDYDRKQSFSDGKPQKPTFDFVPPEKVSPNENSEEIMEKDVDETPEKENEEALWQPTNLIDYDHKSSKSEDLEVSLEPLRSFDYRHKSVNRIPFPQRPKWLANMLKKFPEFDFVIPRTYEQPPYNRFPDRYDRYSDSGRFENRWNNREPPASRRTAEEPNRSQKRYDDYGPSMSRRSHDGTGYSKKDYDRNVEDVEMRDDSKHDNYKSKSSMEVKGPEDSFVNKQDKEKSPQRSSKPRSNVTLIQDILNPPGRYNRPARIVIILRGPPGSGKTFLAKLIKDKEVENGGSAPRILSLDDYFMVEQEKEAEVDGKKTKVKEMVYEYEECMENAYRTSLFKSFKKTITDGYFPFIIVDNINDKVKYFGEMWSFAKQNGFQVYICQMEFDMNTCIKRNVHGRSETEIQRLISVWEPTPAHHPVLDATSLIQAGSIPEVEMEEINSPPSEDFDSQDLEDRVCRSKWDNFDCSIDNLAKLDGTSKPLRTSRTMEDYLHCDDDWVSRESIKPGQKRVRWADLEEQKTQEKMRAIGFVVGQTNWDRMMDPTMGSSALTQTKYIERINNPRYFDG